MKYLLIFGYHLTEKHKDFPTLRVSLDGNFVTDFKCDNEDLTKISVTRSGSTDIYVPIGGFGDTHVETKTQTWKMPKKQKVIELDSDNLKDGSVIRIETFDNFSNYTNGFVTKRSIVSLQPVYLIPKGLFENKSMLEKIVRVTFAKAMFRDMDDRAGRWPWPGPIEPWPEQKGGNFAMDFEVKKKLNFYFIKEKGQPHNTLGFPLVRYFFYAWLNNVHKANRRLSYKGKIDLTGSKSKEYNVEFEEINTKHEDQ